MVDLAPTIATVLGEHADIAAGYLYGSAARGSATPLSDVDVAVLPRPELDPAARGALQRRLMDRLETALRGRRVEVRFFDELPVAIRGRVLRDGQRVLDRVPELRVRAEVQTLMEYHDFLYFERAGTADWIRAVRERRVDG
jgi:predicted nucleotidyltransferase